MQKFRTNYQIKSPQIRLIDEQGKQVGIIDIREALETAKKKGLDLIEVAPKAIPPVCKLIDYGKYKYQLKKIERKEKLNEKRNSITKNIRISINISEHDMNFRIDQARKFLEKKYRVKVELLLRGREITHIDLAKEKISNFIQAFGDEIKIEMPMKQVGKKLMIGFAKLEKISK